MSAIPVMYCTHCGVMLRWIPRGKWLHPSTPCSLIAKEHNDNGHQGDDQASEA